MDTFINFQTIKYIEELYNNFPNDQIFDCDKIYTYMVKTTLLQLTGVLENKLQMVKIKLAEISHDYRYELLKNNIFLSATLKNIKGVLDNILNICEVNIETKRFVQETSLTDENNFCLFGSSEKLCESYSDVVNIFNVTMINKNYDLSYFINFCKNMKDNKKYNRVYENAYKRRNSIAHNLESLYVDNYISLIEKNEELYNNIYAQF